MKKFITFKNIEIKKDKEDHVFEAIITNDALDRDSEVLLPEGMDYKDYLSNPVVFYNHDYSAPIASTIKLHKYKSAWKAKVKMAVRPSDYEGTYFPEYIWSLIKQGVVKGISVGFQVVDSRTPSKKDLKDFGASVKNIITRWKLLEFSIAPLQANPEALITSVSKGLISKEDCKKYFEFEVPEVSLVTEIPISISLKKKKSLEDKIKTKISIELKKRTGQLYI